MELQLMKLRKKAGYKNRDKFAEKIGVNKYTYRSWESGAAMMNLEQACMVADALECTLDDLAGREAPEGWSDEFQKELNRCYEACTPDRRAGILQVARDGALASGEAARHVADSPRSFAPNEVNAFQREMDEERVWIDPTPVKIPVVRCDGEREVSLRERSCEHRKALEASETPLLPGKATDA